MCGCVYAYLYQYIHVDSRCMMYASKSYSRYHQPDSTTDALGRQHRTEVWHLKTLPACCPRFLNPIWTQASTFTSKSSKLNQIQPELQLLWIDVCEICWIQQSQEDVQDLLGRIRLPPLGQIDHRHGVIVDVTALPQSLKVLWCSWPIVWGYCCGNDWDMFFEIGIV